MNTTVVEQDTRTERQQAVDGLRRLADLIEDGTLPVPGGAFAQVGCTINEARRNAERLGLEVREYRHFDEPIAAATFVVDKVGCHEVAFTFYGHANHGAPAEVTR